MDESKADCRKCKYFHITWDNRFPYGCKMFGIKSKQLPNLVVFQSSGMQCQGYEEKEKIRK
ncbi:MAG: uracil-DNA glycosylase [Clostridiales bacterium]|nr:uracil-DNA glycosylase [Clostridiales bacterium]